MPLAEGKVTASHLLRALQGTDICVFFQDHDLIYKWIENAPPGWDDRYFIGQTDDAVFEGEQAENVISAKRAVLETGEKNEIEVMAQRDGQTAWFDLFIERDDDEDGKPNGLLCFAVDITEKKRREHNMRELLMEVSHRSRNLLSIVQSLANHSLKAHNNSPQLSRFNERLQSLASTLTVVTAADWDGATVHELISTQLAPFTRQDTVLDINGPDFEVDPNAAIHIGLAFEELAANSMLERHTPIVGSDIGISIDEADDGFTIRWHEKTAFKAQGDSLDALTLQHIVPTALDGSAVIEHADGKLTYTLHVPASNVRQ
ncbi:MAG: HWE histidine kinase domain-containing protein [Pseudomonadota bacterium]